MMTSRVASTDGTTVTTISSLFFSNTSVVVAGALVFVFFSAFLLSFLFSADASTLPAETTPEPAQTLEKTEASTTERFQAPYAGHMCDTRYSKTNETREMDFCKIVQPSRRVSFVYVGKYFVGERICHVLMDKKERPVTPEEGYPFKFLQFDKDIFTFEKLGRCRKPVTFFRRSSAVKGMEFHLARIFIFNKNCGTMDVIPGYYEPIANYCYYSPGPNAPLTTVVTCEVLCVKPGEWAPYGWTVENSFLTSTFLSYKFE